MNGPFHPQPLAAAPAPTGQRPTRHSRARGIGSGWLLSAGLHGALLFVAGRIVGHATVDALDEPAVVMTLDLRSTSFVSRVEECVSDPRSGERSELPSAPSSEWLEPESTPRDFESAFADETGASTPSAVAGTHGGSRSPSVGASVSFTRLPKSATASTTTSGAGGNGTGGPASGPETEGASSVFRPPEITASPAIGYPSKARRMSEEGEVRCRIHVSALGTVEAVEIARSSGSSRLDEAARTGIAEWRFKPATRDGRPCACVVEHVVAFRLTSAATGAR